MIKDLLPLVQKEFDLPVEFEEEILLKDNFSYPSRITIEYENEGYGDIFIEEIDGKLAVMQYRIRKGEWMSLGVGSWKSPTECLKNIKEKCMKGLIDGS